MNEQELAKLLFPEVDQTPEDMEAKYQPRQLPEGAKVTRIAPSPTGFMHLGNLYGALVDERLAHQSKGVFFLRIEDTDAKRAVEGGVRKIIEAFRDFGLRPDEGATMDGETGSYGPYYQSHRKEIYHVFAKSLVERGYAYPCFCTEEELAEMRAKQEANKETTGYYGKYAVWRDASLDAVKEALAAGRSYCIRFRSPGDPSRRVKIKDLVKGDLELPENDQDLVLLKSDGIPTYHFAHVIDDHLMGTTHVVRGEEWLATLPMHLQMFQVLGFKVPKYLHTAQLMKIDPETGTKRKLSKRKDPELALSYYKQQGFPVRAVMEYLMTTLNSNFEEWRLANPALPYEDFKFTTQKMSASGALFDLEKLEDVSKNVISRMTADEVYNAVAEWAEEFDPELYSLLTRDPEYAKAIFAIGRGGKKPRKDFSRWEEVRAYVSFFYDELFAPDDSQMPALPKETLCAVLEDYQKVYNKDDDNSAWFDRIKAMCPQYGLCADMREYKKNPDAYAGSVGDMSMILRVAITGRAQSPDLWVVCQLLGTERVLKRLQEAKDRIGV
ncbi:MAG: glutamate--tRNA ligase [Firmicutes bacterium]|nr:glutamate--tRNA ligase [Bacillota bacterium]